MISMSVCLFVSMSVCLSVRLCISKTTRLIFNKFFVPVTMAVTRLSSDGSAMRYILPVLWMTSYFHIMEGID